MLMHGRSRPVGQIFLLLTAVFYISSSSSVSISFNIEDFHNGKKGTKFMWQQW